MVGKRDGAFRFAAADTLSCGEEVEPPRACGVSTLPLVSAGVGRPTLHCTTA
ncbi:conserved hypothetical protein [Bacillus sp. 349Y]|nr:conserved hypothetical protein [Bacillus sp. 349Y]